MNKTFDFNDYSGILEVAFQKAILASEIVCITSRTPPDFQYPRPRTELCFIYEGGRGQYFPIKKPGTKNDAGSMPDKAHIGRMHITLVTPPSAEEHGRYIGAVRDLMSTIVPEIDAIFALDLNTFGRQKYILQSVKAQETDPTWSEVKGYYESELIYEIRFSQNHIYDIPSLDALFAAMLCTANVPGNLCNCVDPAPVSAILQGAPNARNRVTLQIDHLVESKGYTGGENDGRYFQTGGEPDATTYNILKLDVSSPEATYYLNRYFDGVPPYASYTAAILIDTGATVTMTLLSVDNQEIRNSAGVVIPGFPGILPNQGQWANVALAPTTEGKFRKQEVTIFDVNDPEAVAQQAEAEAEAEEQPQ